MARVGDSLSVANKVRRRVRRSSERMWAVHDFEGDAKAVGMTLLRLVADGELERVRRGVYWRGRRTRFGMTLAPPIAAVRKIVGRQEAVGAAEWYATNLLGLSTQVSPIPVVAVSKRAPTGIPNVRLVDRASRTGRREARLNDYEVTLLEALDGWDRYVEVDAATATFRLLRALAHDSARIDRLVSASPTESPRVRERLRYLLEKSGRTVEAARIEGARSRSSRDRAMRVIGTT